MPSCGERWPVVAGVLEGSRGVGASAAGGRAELEAAREVGRCWPVLAQFSGSCRELARCGEVAERCPAMAGCGRRWRVVAGVARGSAAMPEAGRGQRGRASSWRHLAVVGGFSGSCRGLRRGGRRWGGVAGGGGLCRAFGSCGRRWRVVGSVGRLWAGLAAVPEHRRHLAAELLEDQALRHAVEDGRGVAVAEVAEPADAQGADEPAGHLGRFDAGALEAGSNPGGDARLGRAWVAAGRVAHGQRAPRRARQVGHQDRPGAQGRLQPLVTQPALTCMPVWASGGRCRPTSSSGSSLTRAPAGRGRRQRRRMTR